MYNRSIRGSLSLSLLMILALPANADAATRRRSAPLKTNTSAKPEKTRRLDISAADALEGARNFYIKFTCSEEKGESNKDENKDDTPSEDGEGGSDYPNSNFKACKVGEDFVEKISVVPKTKITLTEDKSGGFRILGNFKKGTYTVKIPKGAQSKTGAVLADTFEQTIEVPARSARVNFSSAGRYLPRKNLKSISIQSVNSTKVKLEVDHIREDNILSWLREYSENSTSDIADTAGSKIITVNAKEDENTISSIDLSSLIGQPKKGVYRIHALVDAKLGDDNIMSKLTFWKQDDEEKPKEESVKGKGDIRYIVLTDLNIVAKWQSGSKKYLVGVLDSNSGAPVKGALVKAVTKSGRVLSECKTTAVGCEIPQLDSSAFALLASHEDDLTYLRFKDLKLQITEEDTHGPAFSGRTPYDAALYGDRDIYRPGETVRIVTVVREKDYSAPPAGMPVSLNVIDSRGRLLRTFTQKLNSAGVFENSLKLDTSASTGTYKAELQIANKSVQSMDFKVEEFAPERIRITGNFGKNSYLARDAIQLDFKAEYLFGGTAAGAPFEVLCELEPALFKPALNPDFQYGIWRPDEEEKNRRAISLGSDKGKLDNDGRGSANCPAPQDNARFAGMSQIVTRTSVMEAGSGKTSQKTFRAPVHPDSFYLGLKTSTTKMKEGETALVKGIIVDHSGNIVASNSEIEIQILSVKMEYNWTYDNNTDTYSFKKKMHRQFESKTKIKSTAGRFEFPFVAPSVAPLYIVRAQSGKSRTEIQIEGSGSGWSWADDWDYDSNATSAPGRATPLKLKVPAEIAEGETAGLKVTFPFKGWALFTVETDKILRSEWREIKEAGTTDWNFSVNEFNPNVYVSVLLIKDPHQESAQSFLPERAFGVASVRMTPAKYSAELRISSPEEVRPQSELTVNLNLRSSDPESFVTLAAVDEGILQLTGFETPDPLRQLLKQRGLGVETFETIGWNMLVPSHETLSKSGGDSNSSRSNAGPRPVKPVALWSGLLPVDKSGRATVTFKLPVFRGELRLMAVATGKSKISSASAKVKVTEPIVMQATGPRFLTQGDIAQIPVFLTNTTAADKKVEISAVARNFDAGNGDSAFGGPARAAVSIISANTVTLNLPKKSSAMATFRIKTNISHGGAKLIFTARSGEERTTDEIEFPLQSPEVTTRTRTIVSVKAGSNSVDYPKFETGTEKATILLTGNPWSPAVAELLPSLLQYPHGCIEQTTSKLRPLVYLSELVGDLDPMLSKTEKIPQYVEAGIQRILSMQTGSGGFGYWPGSQQPDVFGTVYATHVLMDAQKAGYAVPERRLRSALKYIAEILTNEFSRNQADIAFSREYYGWNAEPYMHYLMARAGSANKARISALLKEGGNSSSGNPDSLESLYLLKAALFLAGDKSYATDLKSPILPAQFASNNSSVGTNQEWRRFGYYSDFRALGLMLNIHAELFPNDPSVTRLADAVVSGFGRSNWSYNTQELGWGLTGLGKIVSSTSLEGLSPELVLGRKTKLDRIKINKGKEWLWRIRNPSGEPLSLQLGKNQTAENAFIVVTAEGVPTEKIPAKVSQGLLLEREYIDLNGSPIDLSRPVALGKIVVARLKLVNTSNELLKNIALTERFPAGFEVENPRIGRSANFNWIDKDKLWKTDYLDVRDNSVSFFGDLSNGQTVEVVVALRATLTGEFIASSSDAQSMYDARIIARIAGAKATITQNGR